MFKRILDVTVSALVLVAAAPLLVAAAVGIILSDGRPVLYRAQRVGRNGTLFTMHKLRTMLPGRAAGSTITSPNDARVFKFGALLRKLKIDEFPQFFDVVRGEMSLVGPRPEDPSIVALFSTTQRETLMVRPGIASPGAIYNYTHGSQYLSDDDPERSYVERLLPLKIALEVIYVRRASPLYDCRVMARTIAVVIMTMAGRRRFPDPPEMSDALLLLDGETRG